MYELGGGVDKVRVISEISTWFLLGVSPSNSFSSFGSSSKPSHSSLPFFIRDSHIDEFSGRREGGA